MTWKQRLAKNFKAYGDAYCSYEPVYSVFRTSSRGEYFLLYNGKSPEEAADAYLQECNNPKSVGIEVRVDGRTIRNF